MSNDKITLANLITDPPKGYDTTYQDIECIKYKGYSMSYRSWDSIKGLVDWKDKVVYDLSCFHGYFLFKAIDAEAKEAFSMGLDRCKPALDTCQLINNIRGSNALFKEWNAGDPIPGPTPDILLCLNCFHHYEDQMIPTLKSMKAKQRIIFEIMRKDIDMVNKHTHVISSHKSARPERIILVCTK